MENVRCQDSFRSVELEVQSPPSYSYHYYAPSSSSRTGIPCAPAPAAGNLISSSSVSQAWVVPVPVNNIPAEPPPPYSEVDLANRPYVPVPEQQNRVTPIDRPTVPNAMPPRSPTVAKPIKIKKEYLWSKLCILKILEFLVCLIAFSTCASVHNSIALPMNHSDRSGFFIFLLVACWLFSALMFWLNLIGFLDKYDNKPNAFKMMILHFVLSFLLLVSSSLLGGMKLCQFSYLHVCQTYQIAVAFGFVAMALFFIDTVIQYLNYRDR